MDFVGISIALIQILFIVVCLRMLQSYDKQMQRFENYHQLTVNGVLLTAESIRRHDRWAEKTTVDFMRWRAQVDSTLKKEVKTDGGEGSEK